MKRQKAPEITLPIEQYKLGECFICGLECGKHYAHYECCVAYSDDKERKIREWNKEPIEENKEKAIDL